MNGAYAGGGEDVLDILANLRANAVTRDECHSDFLHRVNDNE